MIEAYPCAKTTAIVAAIMDVSIDAIRGFNRGRRFVRPRQVTMYLARTVRGLSYPAIGRGLRKDHTTVMHAVKKVRAEMLRDPEFADVVELCRQEVEADMLATMRQQRQRRAEGASRLPLVITTREVLDLAGISAPTLVKRIAGGSMPKSVGTKGNERLYDRDAVLRALGLLNEPQPIYQEEHAAP